MKTMIKFWIALGVLVVLSPLGLILPEIFKAGSAWGEWGGEEIKKLVGYVPQGFEKLSSLWNAPLPDYALKGGEQKNLWFLSFAYIVSGVAGAGLTVLIVFLIGRVLINKGDAHVEKK